MINVAKEPINVAEYVTVERLQNTLGVFFMINMSAKQNTDATRNV